MKTKLEIIEETVDHIRLHGRGVDRDGNCVYYDSWTGKMCAVGRCLIEPSTVDDGAVRYLMPLDEILKPEYRGHSLDFWSGLQDFHDRSDSWHDNGELTQIGESHYAELLERWTE